MLFRIEGQQRTDLAPATTASKSSGPQEVFSVSLDREMLQALAAELKKLGLDTSRLEAPSRQGRQVSGNHAGIVRFLPPPRQDFVPQFQHDAKVLSVW